MMKRNLSPRIDATPQVESTQHDEDDNHCVYENLDPDKLVDAYGFGRYQIFGYFLTEVMNFFYSAALYVMPYVEPEPILHCSYRNESVPVDESCRIKENNSTSIEGICGVIEDTVLRVIDPPYSTTLLKEFDISCSSFVWKEAGLTAFTVGAVLLVPIMSTLADEYGRRPLAVLCLCLAFFCHCLAALSPNYYIFVALRFIIGASSDTYYSLCSILSCELIPSKSRAWITVVQTIAWVFGMFWVGILSLFIHEWRLMYFACAAPGVVSVLYHFYLPESPHWLIQHAQYKGIEKYIERSNKWNNTVVDLDRCRRSGIVVEEKREPLSAMLKSPALLKLLFINGFVQFSMAFYYFGISFLSVDLSEDRFTAYMLSAFVELPGGLVVTPLMLYAGRRILCVTSIALQGLFVMVAPFFRDTEWIMVTFFLAGKLVNSITYSVHPIYMTEQVPTSVRSMSYSIINIPQSLGIIVAPYLRHIELGPYYVKFVGVGLICLTAAALCLLLPETKERPLPPDIRSLTASDEYTVDMRDREQLMEEQNLDDEENTEDDQSPSSCADLLCPASSKCFEFQNRAACYNTNCGKGEVFSECSSYCEPTCEPPTMACIQSCGPPACQCRPGYVRRNGVCIDLKLCPESKPTSQSYAKKPTCAEVRVKCQADHHCEDTPTGITCAPDPVCPKNEVFNICATDCEPTCVPMGRPCHADCFPPKCQCKEGFVRDAGKCIERSKCPRMSPPVKTTQSYVDEPVTPAPSSLDCSGATIQILCVTGFHCEIANGEPVCVSDTIPLPPLELKPWACAVTPIDCAIGTHCEEVDGKAQCVKNPGPCAAAFCAGGECIEYDGGFGCFETTCGLNEEFKRCSSCEQTCGAPTVCAAVCMKPKCQCKEGFVRERGQCVSRKMCPRTGAPATTTQSYVDEPLTPVVEPLFTCATAPPRFCRKGAHCEDIGGSAQCVANKAPVPDPIKPWACAVTPLKCAEGTHCEEVDGQAQCVDNPGPCASVRCAGVECIEYDNTFGCFNTTCEANEEFKRCSSCEQTCNPAVGCATVCQPPKCQCKDGFVRERGKCVPSTVCSGSRPAAQSYVDEPILPAEQSTCAMTLMLCKDGTHCEDVDGKPQCVDNPACGPNEVYLECASCEPTCGPIVPCLPVCFPPACQCIGGYVRNKGKCIPRSQCKESYSNGDWTESMPYRRRQHL
ncbi:hypothetical protein Q1695_004289 [Nippostrongylus brasiliensis]|nr:hypothetical protein Q1695_004289 [Nippostrongylus brasiliensis]